jgi:hypothetical protein
MGSRFLGPAMFFEHVGFPFSRKLGGDSFGLIQVCSSFCFLSFRGIFCRFGKIRLHHNLLFCFVVKTQIPYVPRLSFR